MKSTVIPGRAEREPGTHKRLCCRNAHDRFNITDVFRVYGFRALRFAKPRNDR
jgi:hypothetical protein